MKDRHRHIPEDSLLLKTIYRQVDEDLRVNRLKFTTILWGKFIFYASLLITIYWVLYKIENVYLFVAAFILYGLAALLFAFNFAHDFSHGTIFRKPAWDNLGFILIYAINGAHAEAWKKRHIASHHFAPNVEHYDSDLEISNLIRVIPGSRQSWYHRFQHLYAPVAYTTYSMFWIFVKDFSILFSSENRHSIRYHVSFWAQKLFYFFYLLALPAMFAPHPWYVVLLGFMLMHVCLSLLLLFTFFMTHHVEGVEYPVADKDGYISTSWVMNQIKSSNDMYPYSPLANFIFGGFNNHIAHHLFPHVHHIHYPALNRTLYRILTDHDIKPNQTTYWGGICSHLRLLKKMGLPEAADSLRKETISSVA